MRLTLAVALEAFVRSRCGPADAHLPLETLLRGRDRVWVGRDAEASREHLAICRTCADKVLGLELLLGPDHGEQPVLSALELEHDWRRLARSLGWR